MIQSNEERQKDFFDRKYSDPIAGEYDDNDPFDVFVRRSRVRYIKRFLRPNCRGCGNGNLRLQVCLDARVEQAVGLDVSSAGIELAKRRNSNARIDFHVISDDITRKLGEFDLIMCLNVIEHVDSPMRLLDFLTRHLRREGTLILSSPNRNRIENRIRKLMGKQTALIDPSHVREFSIPELRVMFASRGLEVTGWKAQSLWGTLGPALVPRKFRMKLKWLWNNRLDHYAGSVFPPLAAHVIFACRRRAVELPACGA